MNEKKSIKRISSTKYLVGCCALSLIILFVGYFYTIPPSLIAVEVLLTVLGLFIFGSARYRLDKNALSYGAGAVIFATFVNTWWANSQLKQSIQVEGVNVLLRFLQKHLLTLKGLDNLVHADTLLFILGLTLFVAVIAQTRLLEKISISVLQKNRGYIVPTIAIIAAIVAFSSGILDGVSMIGLTIRILVMILFLARVKEDVAIYVVMISTIVTTVCGIWLAYGEPPNLIIKANLQPYLGNAFFLRYCLPIAVGSYLIIVWNLRKKLIGCAIDMDKLDILDAHMADVRFLQAARHGEVLIPSEFISQHAKELEPHHKIIERRLREGEPLGVAMIKESVPQKARRKLLGLFLTQNLAHGLDRHYEHITNGGVENGDNWAIEIKTTFKSMRSQIRRAQWIGGISFIPFVGLLIWHARDHAIPLFFASFAGFIVALTGIAPMAKIRALAFREALHEYKEYLFLIPLFFSIALLQKTGFFNQLSSLLHNSIAYFGISHVAYGQFVGTTFLSAILDNNVVADFSSRALQGLGVGILHLFAMAQIAGYAVGGCWTHIGSAQSVVAYAFIRRQIEDDYTPIQWIKAMTPIILEIIVLMTVIVYVEGWVLSHLFVK